MAKGRLNKIVSKASNKKSSKNYNNIVIGSVINSINSRAVVGGIVAFAMAATRHLFEYGDGP